jgi:hypothetical protein
MKLSLGTIKKVMFQNIQGIRLHSRDGKICFHLGCMFHISSFETAVTVNGLLIKLACFYYSL